MKGICICCAALVGAQAGLCLGAEAGETDARPTKDAMAWIRGEIGRMRPECDAGKLKAAEEIPVWRGKVRAKVVELLGLSGRYDVPFRLVAELPREGYVLRKYEFSPRTNLVTEMWMLVPNAALKAAAGTVPAVVCVPGTNASLASLADEPDGAFIRYPLRNRQAYYYARAGLIAVAVENFAAGPSSGGLRNGIYSEHAQVVGETIYGVSADNVLCCVDFLKRQAAVDPKRIAVSGMSLGCFPIMYAAVASDDIAAVVYNDFVCSWATRYHATGGSYFWKSRDMPGFYRWFDDNPDLLAALAPRPLFLVEDGQAVGGVDKIRRTYELAGAKDSLKVRRYPKYEKDSARPHVGEDLMKARLSEPEFLRRANCDPSQHAFHPDAVIPWICGTFGLKADFDKLFAAELEAAATEREHFRTDPHPTLVLKRGPDNPRNGEGDMILLDKGRIMLVYAEHRGDSFLDHSPAHLVKRISRDDGETWSAPVEVVPRLGRQNDMSVSLLRLKDGRIALFYCRKNGDNDCMPIVRFSSDEGETWSEPAECLPKEKTAYYVINNARVVTLASGRIVLPLCRHTCLGKQKWDMSGYLVCAYSDDLGRTWKTGREYRPTDGKGAVVCVQEPGLVELKDGRLYLYARTDRGRQWQGFSKDGGETWGDFGPSPIMGPLGPATIHRLKTGELLLVWNDHETHPSYAKVGDKWMCGLRAPVMLALSWDEGRTWTNRKALEEDPRGYFCYYSVLELENNLLLSYYSGRTGKADVAEFTVMKVPMSWLELKVNQ